MLRPEPACRRHRARLQHEIQFRAGSRPRVGPGVVRRSAGERDCAGLEPVGVLQLLRRRDAVRARRGRLPRRENRISAERGSDPERANDFCRPQRRRPLGRDRVA